MHPPEPAGGARVLVGGVGYRWMRDASFGLVLADALSALDWPAEVEVADLGYGALYAAQDVADASPSYERVILLSAAARGRRPGRLYRRRWRPVALEPIVLQERIREAGAGVIDLDHLLVIGQHFDAWPDDVVIVELEPLELGDAAVGGERLSPVAAALLPQAIELVRREVWRAVVPSPAANRVESGTASPSVPTS